MLKPEEALNNIPDGLRIPLLKEYRNILQNFMEHKWTPAELSGGLFCEIIYTILIGYELGRYPSQPEKPRNFVQACRNLENNTNSPRSFRILIPRLLPALYEIRNNRGVGHVGGDVDSNYMDSYAVVSISSWIMAELIRVYHQLKIEDAQLLVDSLVELKIPLIYQIGDIKRVLKPELSLKDQILLLLLSSNKAVRINDLFNWIEYHNKSYFNRMLKDLHKKRFIELNETKNEINILPPGTVYINEIILSELSI